MQTRLQDSGPSANVNENQRPTELPEGARLERREDGSVWQVTPAIPAHDKDGKELPGPDTLEFRVDSPKDADYIKKGGTPWYYRFLDEPTPNSDRGPTVETQLASLLERVEAAEARALVAEARVSTVETRMGDGESSPRGIETGDDPKPIVLNKKPAGKKGKN